MPEFAGFRHPSLFSRRGDGGEVFEVKNLKNKNELIGINTK
jgi:hypothetical protein